jgi:hypothetical protein
MSLMLSQKDARKGKRLLAQPRPCLRCGDPQPTYTGLVTPHQPEAWGGTPGKVRVLASTLCGRCCGLPDRTLHVEARIMAGLVGARH